MIRLANAAKELHLLLGLRLGLTLASLLLLLLLIPFASPLALTAAIAAVVVGDAQLGAQYITGIRISCVQLTEARSDPLVGIGCTEQKSTPPPPHIGYIYFRVPLAALLTILGHNLLAIH